MIFLARYCFIVMHEYLLYLEILISQLNTAYLGIIHDTKMGMYLI